MRLLFVMLLLSWGVAQHPDLPALPTDAPATHSETQSSEAQSSEAQSVESSEGTNAISDASPAPEGTAETENGTGEGHSEGASHTQASSENSERIGPPVVNTNLAEELLILFGSFFVLAAAIGMLRFPDFYTRLHASTKLVTLGGIGILIGAAFGFNDVQVSLRVILIIVFFFLTAPLSGYMIGRAGYLRGLPFYKEWGSIDEWQALGSGSTEPEATD